MVGDNLMHTSSLIKQAVFLITIIWAVASCTPQTDSTISAARAEPVDASRATAIPNPTPTLIPTPTPAPLETATPATTETNPLTGLIYNHNGFWLIDENGQPQLLTEEYGAKFSPDRTQILHGQSSYDDIWLKDLTTGQTTNLTNTPDTQEGNYQWWPANPEHIIFMARPMDQLGPWAGYLGFVNKDGSNYTILDDIGSSHAPALSPNGKTIALDRGAEPWLYHWDTGTFEPITIQDKHIDAFLAPAWSPDSSQIAWAVRGNFDGSTSKTNQLATIVYDMSTQTSRVLHPYSPTIGTEDYRTVDWSPDGQWLIFTTIGDPTCNGRGAVVLARADGSEDHCLGASYNYAWHPTKQQLAYTAWNQADNTHTHLLLTIGTWAETPLNLPVEDANLVDWIEL